MSIIIILGAVIAFVAAIIGIARNSIQETAIGVIVLAVTLFLIGIGLAK
jgi:hypothetical protein